MTKRRLHQINLIPRKRLSYAVVGLLLSSILFATCATVFIGVYSYISTYLGDSDDTLILTQSGTGNFIATRYISKNIADSADYIQGVTLVSPETLTPCMIGGKSCFVRGIICNKFFSLESLSLQSGRFLTEDDIFGAFIGSHAAQRLQLSVGDSFIVYSGLRDVSLQLTAIGIFSSKEIALNDEILIPLYAGQMLSENYPNQVTYIRIKYNDSVIARDVLEELLTSQHELTVQLDYNETGTPIQEGEVEIYDLHGTFLESSSTDSLGETTFSLDFGNYTVIAIKDEVEVTSSVFLQMDQTISLKIPQIQTAFPLIVKVLNENNVGMPYITVVAWREFEIFQMQQTNSSGVTTFSLPSDTYEFSTLIWNNFTQEPIEFRQTANPTQVESVIFKYQHFTLGVRTNDPYSGKFLNASVEIKLINGTVIAAGETGDFGYVEFEDLSPTTYNVTVNYLGILRNQIIVLRSDRTVTFEILPQFTLQVNVFNDSTQLPMNNTYVKIFDSSNNPFENYTDEDGIANFLLELDTYNITVHSNSFIKNRTVYLDSNRNETFWMPKYNLTIIIKNITGDIQDDINVTLLSSSLNESQLSQNGLVTFFVPPDSYNITLNCSNVFISQIHEIDDPLDPITFIIPPYNLSVSVLNGTVIGTPPLSNINVSILDHPTQSYVTSLLTTDGVSSFLLNPGQYNVSVNVSNVIYDQLIDLNEEYSEITFYSYPFNLSIYLTNGTTSEPQPNLQVQLYDLLYNLTAGPNITNVVGQVSFLVNPMTYNITINSSDYLIHKIRTITAPNTVYSFEFPPYNLTLMVYNASDNSPLQNALIEILQFEDNSTLFSKYTSIEGVAQFSLDPGKYYINLTFEEYNFIQFKEIVADPVINYHIPPYKLTVQVIDYGGDPLQDANISVNGGELFTTNESGYINFYLNPDIYNITASWYNYSDFEILDMRTYQASFLVTIRLTPKVFLNTSVVNAISGQPLANFSVEIFDFPGEPIATKLTDQDGFCQFHLMPNVYNISITRDESHEYQLINLTTDETVVFSIIPSYKLSIFTYDDSATYFTKDVMVQILKIGGVPLFQDITDDIGGCSFILESGIYVVNLSKGVEQKSEIIHITESTLLTFHMAPYKVTVSVRNLTSSNPIPGALITIRSIEGVEVVSNLTNEFGIAEFLMEPDHYYIYLNISGDCWIKELDIRQCESSLSIVFSISAEAPSDIEVGDPLEYSVSLLQQTFGLTESVVYILAIILTILVSFSIMNVVSSCVSESRKYIGTIRSLGASNRQLIYIINLRILLVSVVGGSLGGLLGILLGSAISIGSLEISLAQIITPQLFFSLFMLAIGITLLIGIISANLTLYRILRMPIATSIREILPQTV